MAKPLVERFWEKVQKTDGCWPWAGVTARSTGYGYIWAHGRMNYAHRTAWLLTHGPILEGLWVLHHCDVPACCNPAHLFLGTHSDNMRDMNAKGRRGTIGARHGHAKLDETAVLDIRQRHAAGGITQRALATQHGISQRTISQIIRRKTWRHAR
jgi:hypothetical protein